MNIKITAAVAILAAMLGQVCPVHAQSSVKPSNNHTKSGASLTGINDRTAQQDFGRFFPQGRNYQNTSGGNMSNSIAPNADASWQVGEQVELRRNVDQPLSAPNSVIFPQSIQSSFDGNNGVQVQYDLLRGVDGNR